MNNLDKTYTDLLQDILDNGVKKQTRNGEVLSVFGRQIRHNMKDGFPLLTTKKMAWKSIVTELLWFLRGDTNIKYLVQNGCMIWNGDCYKNYTQTKVLKTENSETHISPQGHYNNLTQEEFINKIKTDDEFAKKWGDLGKIYGFQWRNWGGWKDTKQTGFLHKTDNGWTVKWSDLHSFANGTEWLTTPIQDSDQSLYSDEDEGKKVYYKNITLGYNESFCPIQVAKVIDDKFDKYVGGKDQIANLINDLKTNPDSRRLMVNAWTVSELDQMVLPPCHYGFQVYTRELSWYERAEIDGFMEGTKEALRESYIYKSNFNGHKFYGLFSDTDTIEEIFDKLNIPTRAISLMWNQRSCDTFLGLPFNIASYGLLLEIIAKEVNMVPDQLIGNLGDVHLYSNHIEQAKEQIGRDLTDEERYNIWFTNNYETGMERYFDPNNLPDYENDYYNPTPKRTREPFPLPTLKFNPCPITGISMEYQSIAQFEIENYQSHPAIKAPLSN